MSTFFKPNKNQDNHQNPAYAYYPEPLFFKTADEISDPENSQHAQNTTYPHGFEENSSSNNLNINSTQIDNSAKIQNNTTFQNQNSQTQNLSLFGGKENLLNMLKGNNNEMLSTLLASGLFGGQKNLTEIMSKMITQSNQPKKTETTKSHSNVTFEEM